jgi:hypothetical protein
MILWTRRAGAILSGIFLVALLLSVGYLLVGVAGGVLNLALVWIEKFPLRLRRFLPSFMLVTNTILSACGILAGGSAVWAVSVAVLSLFSWNTERFGQRWDDIPRPLESRYLKRVGSLAAMGLGAGLSAEVCQGNFSIPFSLALLAMMVGGVLLLRLMSQTSKHLKLSSPPNRINGSV